MQVYEIEGHDLEMLQRMLREGTIVPTYKLRVVIDGGVKAKVNEGSWTPPMGEVR